MGALYVRGVVVVVDVEGGCSAVIERVWCDGASVRQRGAVGPRVWMDERVALGGSGVCHSRRRTLYCTKRANRVRLLPKL